MSRSRAVSSKDTPKQSKGGRGAAITKKAVDFEFDTVPGGGRATKAGIEVAGSRATVEDESSQLLTAKGELGKVVPGHVGLDEETGVLATSPSDDAPTGPDLGDIAISPEGTASPSWVPGKYGGDKTKGSGMKVSLTGTVGPQVPAELRAAKYAVAKNAALIENLGLQARSDALNLMVNIREDFEHKWKTAFEKTGREIEEIIYEAEEEKNAMGELMDRVRSDRINPGQFFANIGAAGRFSAALAVAAGSMATAFGGGPNVAYGIISSAIDRNVQAQVVNMRHNVQAAYAQMNFINSIRGLTNTKMNYAHYLRMGLAGIAQNQLAQVQLSAESALAQLGAKDVWNRFGAMVVDSEIQAITALQSKATWKLTSLAQVSQVSGYIASQGRQQATGAQGVQRATGKPPSASGGQPRTQEVPTATQGNIGTSLQGFINEASERGNPLTPEQIRNKAVNLLRSGGGEVTEEVRDNAVRALEQLGEGAAALKLKGVRQDDLQPETVAKRKVMTIGGLGDVRYVITDQKAWDAKGQKLGDLKREVQAPLQLYSKTKKAYDLLSAINAGTSGWARYFRRYHGEFKFLPSGGADMKQDAAALRLLREDMMETLRKSEGTRNALNLKHEIERYEIRTGAGIANLEELFDNIRNEPEEWKARIIPALEKAQDAVQEVEDTSGIRFDRNYD